MRLRNLPSSSAHSLWFARRRVWATALVAACALLAAQPSRAGDDAPGWLRQAAAGAPAFDRSVPAVVLMDEGTIRVGEDGRVTRTQRYAVRILSSEGRGAAQAGVTYNTDSEKVREIRAWMIRPSGEVRRYDGKDVIDHALVDNDIYNEARGKLISARDDAEPGAVFGYEVTTEERTVFTQLHWAFQGRRLPVVVSRCQLQLPAGWTAQGVTFNHPRVEPVTSGSTYTWELRNLPFIEDEPASPPVSHLAPLLAVSYYPPPGVRPELGRTFKDWTDVSRWLTELAEPQATLSPALEARARELAAGKKSEFERIAAIGRFVQSINYVSIQIGVGRGGGYRPRPAAEVFTRGYGDCKDKANLMRAMLKAVGIPSYLVTIYAGDPNYVREEWPSPQQFNHCIIAVKVRDETQAATVVTHPQLGRLLIFDPTDDMTPVGDLPEHEQGSLALVIAGEQGALLRMPVTPPEVNRLEREADVELGADGSIKARLRERSTGQAAAQERVLFRSRSSADYLKAIERWITAGATGATVTRVEPADNGAEGKFSLDVEFSAARYGQVMQGRLIVFKPAIVSRRESLFLTEAERKHPVVLEGHAYEEKVRVKLPAGFVVDELPDAVSLEAPFGRYTTSYEVKDGHLEFRRALLVRSATVPVSDYAKVRGFFERVRAAEQSPVVLARQ